VFDLLPSTLMEPPDVLTKSSPDDKLKFLVKYGVSLISFEKA